MTTVVTLADINRRERVVAQHEYLLQTAHDAGEDAPRHGVVILGPEKFAVDGVEVIAHLSDRQPHLATARNLAGDWATSSESGRSMENETLIFLDADCVPGSGLLRRYRQALEQEPSAVVTGPVTYLQEADSQLEQIRAGVQNPSWLGQLRQPHPARPEIEGTQMRKAKKQEYDVFWSLTFALTGATWRRFRRSWGGFDETFRGYGGEDTDFGWQMREHGVPLFWVGGADAFHVWHPVSSPPWEHLHDIVENANRFFAKWGKWPMKDWLDAFERDGAVRLNASADEYETVDAHPSQ